MLKTRAISVRTSALSLFVAVFGLGLSAKGLAESEPIALTNSPNMLPVHIVGGKTESVSGGTVFRTVSFVVDAAFYFPCNVPQSDDEIAWRFIARDNEKRDIYEIAQIRKADAPTCLPVREPIIVKLRSKGMPFVRLTAPSAFVVNTHELPVEF